MKILSALHTKLCAAIGTKANPATIGCTAHKNYFNKDAKSVDIASFSFIPSSSNFFMISFASLLRTKFVITSFLLAVSFLFVNNVFGQATLTSDSADYQPGSTATLTGTGFWPGETVRMQVLHADYIPGEPYGADHDPWFITADASGNFITTWHVCEDDCKGKLLRASAIGQSSSLEAETFFTDATVTTGGSGSWSSTTNNAPWPGGTIPLVADDIVVGTGFTLTVDGNRICNSITLTNGATLIVNSGVTLTVTTGITLRNSITANTSATISGLGTISAASLNVISVDGNGDGIYTATLNSAIATLNISGSVTINSNRGNNDFRYRNGVLSISTGTVNVSGGIITVNEHALNTSTLTLAATAPQDATLNIGGANPFTLSPTVGSTSTIILNGTSSTVNYNRAGNQSIRNTTYNNLQINGIGEKSLGGSGTTVNGNLTVNGTFANSGGIQLSGSGNIVVNSGGVF